MRPSCLSQRINFWSQMWFGQCRSSATKVVKSDSKSGAIDSMMSNTKIPIHLDVCSTIHGNKSWFRMIHHTSRWSLSQQNKLVWQPMRCAIFFIYWLSPIISLWYADLLLHIEISHWRVQYRNTRWVFQQPVNDSTRLQVQARGRWIALYHQNIPTLKILVL